MTDPRDASVIRDEFLDTLQTEYRAIGRRVVTVPGSPWYALGTSVGIETEGAEAEAAAALLEPFPLTCSDAGVVRHADWSGLPRLAASHTTLRIRAVGTTSSTLTIPAGAYLTSPAGLIFDADAGDVTTDGSGYVFLAVVAREAGSAANLASGTVMRWQPAPSGFTATATVLASSGDSTPVLVTGADEETIAAWRLRLHVWRREKAQGGNRAEWAQNVEAVEGVGGACVYPRTYYSFGTWHYGHAGTLIVVPLASAPPAGSYVQNSDGTLGQGLSPDTSRIPTTTLITRIGDYIEGTGDAQGRAVPSSIQQEHRPCGFAPGSYTIRRPTGEDCVVGILIRTDPAIAPWPWMPAVDRLVTDATTSTVTLNSVAGVNTNDRIAIECDSTIIRGNRWCAVVTDVTGSVVTFTPPMLVAPAVGALVSPDPGLYAQIRAAVLAIFDGLGARDVPDDDTDAVASARFPRPADRLPQSIQPSDIVVAVRAIRGVTDASAAVTPATPTTTGNILVPSDITLGRMS